MKTTLLIIFLSLPYSYCSSVASLVFLVNDSPSGVTNQEMDTNIVYKITSPELISTIKDRSEQHFRNKLNHLGNESTRSAFLDYTSFPEEELIQKFNEGYKNEIINLLTSSKRLDFQKYEKLISLIESEDSHIDQISPWDYYKIRNGIGNYEFILKSYIFRHNQDEILGGFHMLVEDIRVEEDTQLKQEAYESHVKTSIKKGRISLFSSGLTTTLCQFLNHPPTEDYGITKSLEIMKIESEGRKSSWRDLLMELSYHMPKQDWLTLLKELSIDFRHSEGNPYTNSDLYLRYVEFAGYKAFPMLKDALLSEEPKAISYALSGILSLLHTNKLTQEEKETIKTELKYLDQDEIREWRGEMLTVCFHMLGMTESEFRTLYPDDWHKGVWENFSKLNQIEDYSRAYVLERSKELGIISTTEISPEIEDGLYIGGFPLSQVLLCRILQEYEVFSDQGRFGPLIYSKYLNGFLKNTPFNFPEHELFIFQEKHSKSYKHFISILVNGTLYLVIHEESGESHSFRAIKNLINTILADSDIQHRLTKISTESCHLNLYAIPDSIKQLLDEFKIQEESYNIEEPFRVTVLSKDDTLPWKQDYDVQAGILQIEKIKRTGYLYPGKSVIYAHDKENDNNFSLRLRSKKDFSRIDNAVINSIGPLSSFIQQTDEHLYVINKEGDILYKVHHKTIVDSTQLLYKRLSHITANEEYVFYVPEKKFISVKGNDVKEFSYPNFSAHSLPSGEFFKGSVDDPLPRFFSYDSLSVTWSLNPSMRIGRVIESRPSIFCIATTQGKDNSVLSIDIATGNINWETPVNEGYNSNIFHYPEQNLIHWVGSGGVMHLNDATGQLIKELETPPLFKTGYTGYVMNSTSDKVYYNTDGAARRRGKYGTFGCLDVNKGEVAWTYDLLNSPAECPSLSKVVELENGKLLLIYNQAKFHFIFDPDDPANIPLRIISEGKLVNEDYRL